MEYAGFDYCPECDQLVPLYIESTQYDTQWHCQICDKMIDEEVEYDPWRDDEDDDLFV